MADTPWRACYFTFRAAPGCNAETDADQKRNRAADATPRAGVVRENPGGDQAQVQPDRAAETSQDAAARPAASGDHPGQREHGGVLGVVQPPAATSRSSVPPICRGNAVPAVTRRAAPANTARMSSGRDTPAHQDGNDRTSRQYGYAINGTTPIARWQRRWAGREG
jgi:hypothetical protein